MPTSNPPGVSSEVHKALVEYQKARVNFVDTVKNLMQKGNESYIQSLLQADLLPLLCCPLVQDVVPSIQIKSLDILSKLSVQTADLADTLADCGVLNNVVLSLSHESPEVQIAGNRTLQSVAQKNQRCAAAVLEAGLIPPTIRLLESFNADVKEATVRTVNTVCNASREMASEVVDESLVQVLVGNLSAADSSVGLRAAVASLIADVSSCSVELATRLVGMGCIPPLTALTKSRSSPPALLAETLRALGQIAKHTDETAQQVLDSTVLNAALECLTVPSRRVRNCAAMLVLEVVRKTPEMAQMAVDAGAVGAMARNLELEGGTAASLACTLAIGYAAGFAPTTAIQVTQFSGAQLLLELLVPGIPVDVQQAALWAVEQVSAHGEATARVVAEAGGLPILLDAYRHNSPGAPPELKVKAKAALKTVLRNCKCLPALEPLVSVDTPPEVLDQLFLQFLEGLPKSVEDRRTFVTSGALMRLQAVLAAADEAACESIKQINAHFPEDVVQYYAAGRGAAGWGATPGATPRDAFGG